MIPARGATSSAEPAVVRLEDLRTAEMLAEGGEGLVFQLPRQPHLVYKSYRHPVPGGHLGGLVSWSSRLDPGPSDVVRLASAWPTSVVEDSGGDAVGLLMPRAPRRFALRHRDGQSRLASLSYLTADPGHRAAAYGLVLPEPATAERIGIVYALARLLAAFESSDPVVGHGDLSTKNVLWSLQRGPEVYVLDCDSSELFPLGAGGAGGAAVGGGADGRRRRAMTPNWDDPSVPRGTNPTRVTDRYSLALIFMRVVGAANFPVQSRQRAGGPVEVTFPVPAGTPAASVLADPGAPVWSLCARSLSITAAEERPGAGEWAAALDGLLRSVGGSAVEAAVRGQQGGWLPAQPASGTADPDRGGDVVIVPTLGAARAKPVWSKVTPTSRYSAPPDTWSGSRSGAGGAASRSGGLRWVPLQPLSGPSGSSGPAGSAAPPGGGVAGVPGASAGSGITGTGQSAWPEVKAQLARTAKGWVRAHRRALALLFTRHRRAAGAIRLMAWAAVDAVMLVVLAGIVGVVVAPVLGL